MGRMFKKALLIIIFFILNQHSFAVETVKIFEFTDEEMKKDIKKKLLNGLKKFNS